MPNHNNGAKLLAVGLFLVTAAMFYLAGCQSPKPATSIVPETASSEAVFVGNQACETCHADIFKEHHGSNHDRTLRTASQAGMGEQFPKPAKLENHPFVVSESGGSLSLAPKADPNGAIPLNFVLGAGKNGVTFVTPWEGGKLVEAHMSYLPKQKRWFTTPGQNHPDEATRTGVVWNDSIGRRCIGCHSIPRGKFAAFPDEKMFGVGCEACHGPASNHVEAMKRDKKAPLAIEKLSKLGGNGINELCGSCHRTQQGIAKGTDDEASTQRFQPYGLSLSKCFKSSNDALTCMTCHSPHKDAEKGAKYYNPVCQSCHTVGVTPAVKLTRVVACKVQQDGDCIKCHML